MIHLGSLLGICQFIFAFPKGIGLYVSKKIINEHEGTIYYSSKEGRTEFIVTLPV
jgi:sensor histidine kinase regulating citrate/malate metabolism